MLKDQTRACAGCREAIPSGGAQVILFDHAIPLYMACGSAATRLKIAAKRGITTVGLDESVEILARHPGELVRTGLVDAPDRSWHYTLYFDATGTELLACSAVKGRPPATHGDPG